MENYRQRLAEQKEALEKDIANYVKQITDREEELEKWKEGKRLAFRELRGIEKKLAK